MSGESDDSEIENQMKIKNIGGPEKDTKNKGEKGNNLSDGSLDPEDVYLDIKAEADLEMMEVDEDDRDMDKKKK